MQKVRTGVACRLVISSTAIIACILVACSVGLAKSPSMILEGLPVNPNGPAADKFGITGGGIVAYDLDKNGNISNGRVVFRSEEGIGPDGTAMDTEGNLYVAQHNGNREAPKSDIVVISPSGEVQHLPTPGVGLTTNLGFGRGADSHTLYLTTGAPFGLFRIQTLKKGHYWK
jgi:sugar lactone lactonase YvrE